MSQRSEANALVHPNSAGLDIGTREIWACIPPREDGEWVRVFNTFTPDLVALADWLVESGVTTVAMESTGVYWIPVFEMLEARGLDVYLVNARHIKNVPGRKSDYRDCQWIQKLHALGLLSKSFRPSHEIAALRSYLRHRTQLVQHRAPHILHMQKALHYMNIQLTQVLTDITGTTGMEILRAIVAGERDALKLAQMRHPNCKSTEDDIVKALTGDWKPEYLFILQQALALYDFYTQQIYECDKIIEKHFSAIHPTWQTEPAKTSLTPVKSLHKSKNAPAFDARAEIIRITGVDLVAVDGLSDSLAQTILSEIGTDMTRWPTVKHFTSWLGLAPHNDISGGRVLRSHVLDTKNRAGQAFRQAATAVARGPSALGAYYRRMRAKAGPRAAQVATAHKLARIVFHLLSRRVQYIPTTDKNFELRQRQREIALLHKKASQLGFSLSQADPSIPVS